MVLSLSVFVCLGFVGSFVRGMSATRVEGLRRIDHPKLLTVICQTVTVSDTFRLHSLLLLRNSSRSISQSWLASLFCNSRTGLLQQTRRSEEFEC